MKPPYHSTFVQAVLEFIDNRSAMMVNSASMAYPDGVRNLLREIQLIAHVPKEHKVNFQTFSYVSDSFLGGIYRYLTGESHCDLIRRLRDCIRQAQIYRHEYPQYISDLAESLTELLKSIPTYRSIYQSKVDAIIDFNLIEKELKLVIEQLQHT